MKNEKSSPKKLLAELKELRQQIAFAHNNLVPVLQVFCDGIIINVNLAAREMQLVDQRQVYFSPDVSHNSRLWES